MVQESFNAVLEKIKNSFNAVLEKIKNILDGFFSLRYRFKRVPDKWLPLPIKRKMIDLLVNMSDVHFFMSKNAIRDMVNDLESSIMKGRLASTRSCINFLTERISRYHVDSMAGYNKRLYGIEDNGEIVKKKLKKFKNLDSGWL